MFSWPKKKTTLAHQAKNSTHLSANISQEFSKAESLIKLGRQDEANKVLENLQQVVEKQIPQNITSVDQAVAQIVNSFNLANILKQLGKYDAAEKIVLDVQRNKLFTAIKAEAEEGKIELGDELAQVIFRFDVLLKSIRKYRGDNAESLTKADFLVYICAKCGRLIGFISSPCPHCKYQPSTLEEIAQSIGLGADKLPVSDLLMTSRELAKGRDVCAVVPGLDSFAARLLATNRESVESIRKLISEKSVVRNRSIEVLSACPNCGQDIFLSNCEIHQECGKPYTAPTIVRLGCCTNNILRGFELSADIRDENFGGFIASIVKMQTEILWNQRMPSTEDRQLALEQLRKLHVFTVESKAGYIKIGDDLDVNGSVVQEEITKEGYLRVAQMIGELDAFVTYLKTAEDL